MLMASPVPTRGAPKEAPKKNPRPVGAVALLKKSVVVCSFATTVHRVYGGRGDDGIRKLPISLVSLVSGAGVVKKRSTLNRTMRGTEHAFPAFATECLDFRARGTGFPTSVAGRIVGPPLVKNRDLGSIISESDVGLGSRLKGKTVSIVGATGDLSPVWSNPLVVDDGRGIARSRSVHC